MRRNLDLVIFDLDGTLYPANEEMDRVYPRAAMQLLSRKFNRDLEDVCEEFLQKKEELATIIKGTPTSTLTLFYFNEVGFEEFEAELDRQIDVKSYIKADPKCIQIIKKIHSAYPIFLYTTNNDKVSTKILTHIGLTEFFPREKRFTFSTVSRMNLPDSRAKLQYIKPNIKGFLHILERFGVTPERTLMIGDSEVSDILPAQKLGLQTYHVVDRNSFYSLPDWLGI